MILQDTNGILILEQIILQRKPKRILDIGTLCKRNVYVCREHLGGAWADQIYLAGVDFFPEIWFEAWNHIYDKTYGVKEWLSGAAEESFDMGILLGTEELLQQCTKQQLVDEISRTCRCVYTDVLWDEWGREPTFRLASGEMVCWLYELEGK